MKKLFFLVMITFLSLVSFVSAVNLQIEKGADDEAMMVGWDMPAVFDLKIKNFGSTDSFMFYNFFGSDIFPKGTVAIANGETKNVAVGIYPREDMKQEGRFTFDIFIKGTDGSEISYPLKVQIVRPENALEVGAEEFRPDSNTISVYVKNLVNFNFNNVKATFKSPFFNFEKTFSIAPYQKEVFEVTLNKEDFRSLMAGFYTMDVELLAGDEKANVKGTIQFSEKDIVTTFQDEYGLIISTKRITKSNEGNVVSSSSTVVKKNIISRLFTTFSPEPDVVERQGLTIYYTWEKELIPGQQLDILIKTNWLLPLLAVLLVVSIVIIAKQFSKTNLSLRKKVSFVRAKGGEFALKISIIVNARKYVQKVNVIDRLPPLVKLHEKFGGEMPRKVDEHTKRMEWYFDKLQAGETRIISYIIYSKVGVLGKFALPTTTAVYEKEGVLHEAESNHAFFIAEQATKQIEE